MKTKRLFLAIGLLMLLTSCGDDATERMEQARREQQRVDSLALKVAVMPTLDCLPLYVAEAEGWFEREGVSVQLRPYTAQMDEDTAVLFHHVEGLVTDRERMKWIAEQGVELREMGQTDLKWQLVTNKNARIKQLSQLDDKMIAMTRRSATDLLAQHAIDSVGLPPERVFRIQINDVGVRLSMLENSIMDALLLPEPQATQARIQGHPVLMDTEELGLHYGVLAFTEQAATDTMRQRQIETFLRVYNMARDSIAHRGYSTYRQLIADRCHVLPEVADSLDKAAKRSQEQ